MINHDSSRPQPKAVWPFPSSLVPAKIREEKPVVLFIGDPFFFKWREDDEVIVAEVRTLNHPKLGAQRVRTSQVLNKFDDGSFETMNSRYVPAHRV